MHPETRDGWVRMIAALRDRTPDQKLRAASAQRRISLELLRAGIRFREPHLDGDGVEERLRRLIFDDDRRRDPSVGS